MTVKNPNIKTTPAKFLLMGMYVCPACGYGLNSIDENKCCKCGEEKFIVNNEHAVQNSGNQID